MAGGFYDCAYCGEIVPLAQTAWVESPADPVLHEKEGEWPPEIAPARMAKVRVHKKCRRAQQQKMWATYEKQVTQLKAGL